MATLANLVRSGTLTVIQPEGLLANELNERVFYGTERFLKFLEHDLPKIRTSVGDEVTPSAQFADQLRRFVVGRNVNWSRMLKVMRPHENGVWEFRTRDVRVFGWFPIRDNFVAVSGGDKYEIAERGLYANYCDAVVNERQHLMGSDLRVIVGGLYDVLST